MIINHLCSFYFIFEKKTREVREDESPKKDENPQQAPKELLDEEDPDSIFAED